MKFGMFILAAVLVLSFLSPAEAKNNWLGDLLKGGAENTAQSALQNFQRNQERKNDLKWNERERKSYNKTEIERDLSQIDVEARRREMERQQKLLDAQAEMQLKKLQEAASQQPQTYQPILPEIPAEQLPSSSVVPAPIITLEVIIHTDGTYSVLNPEGTADKSGQDIKVKVTFEK